MRFFFPSREREAPTLLLPMTSVSGLTFSLAESRASKAAVGVGSGVPFLDARTRRVVEQ
jgi:hypothetical protein